MSLDELSPLLVGVGGLITAFATWLKVRHGEGNKRLDAELNAKELDLLADAQDNHQIMALVTFQQEMLEKHQARLDDLQAALENKAEREAENRAELRLMRYRITECEEDRLRLRDRVVKLEQSLPPSGEQPPQTSPDTPQ
ncbi:MAG: hypothetical protein WC314_14705 [Vulcanimicrobiota bacterium]